MGRTFLYNGAKLGDWDSYTEFLEDGTMTAVGDAAAWDDLLVPLTTTRVGSNSKPDFDEVNVGYLFPNNNTAEILYFIVQMPHRWKVGTRVYPHVHYRRTAAGVPTYKFVYSWFNIGSAVAAPTETYTLDTEVIPYTSGSIHQINATSSGIDGTGKGISSILVCELYRDDSSVAGDVLTYQFDIHYQVDSLGSRDQYTK
jgi:hypothetical protein